MDIDQGALNTTLSAIGGTVIALAAAFGIGNLLLAAYHRRIKQQDSANEIHETNQGKQIDADIAAFVIVSERLKLVEARQDKLADDLASQREMNAQKDAKIAHLEKENVALEREIQHLNDIIAELRCELDALKAVVAGDHAS